LKIIFLNPIGQIGGAERVLLELLASLRTERPDWKLHLIVGGEGPLLLKARALGITGEIVALPAPLARLGESGEGGPRSWQILCASPSIFFYARKLNSKIRLFQPNLIHTNGLKMDLLGLWARPQNTPVIWHLHDYLGSRPLTAKLMKVFAGQAAQILTNSQSVLQDLRKTCPGVTRATHLPCGVDPERFKPSGSQLDLDALANLKRSNEGVVRVGMVATTAVWKGHKTFLRAISLIPNNLLLRAYVIGGPIYETGNSQYSLEELQSFARELGVSDRVGFTGYIEDIASALRALDIAVHASTSPEPFGLSIIEAMACARPVIASKGGGPEEIIVEGVNGFFHTPGDSRSLAERIVELVRNPELRKRLGEAGRKTAEERFDASKMADRLLAIYERALGAKV
jgi:glycosyltransferase involved in cell wall biosynthesis